LGTSSCRAGSIRPISSIKKRKKSGQTIDYIDTYGIELSVPCPIVHHCALPAGVVAGELSRAFR